MMVSIFACIVFVLLSSLSISGEKAIEDQGISIEEATLRVLENNQAFQIERLNPEIRKTYEDDEKSVFDPTISFDSSRSKSTLVSGIVDLTKIERENNSLEVSKKFSTGTEVSVGVQTQRIDSERSGIQTSAAGVISLNQSLLKGFGRSANLANLRKSNLALRASEFEFRGFAESLVADVEKTCWDYILAQRRISIFQRLVCALTPPSKYLMVQYSG